MKYIHAIDITQCKKSMQQCYKYVRFGMTQA